MTDRPKRFESELTVVIDRNMLPPKPEPLSTLPGSTIEDAPPTLDACPAPGCIDCVTCKGMHHVECGECGSHEKDCPGTCSTCAVCLGRHMLSRDEYDAWKRATEPPPEAA